MDDWDKRLEKYVEGYVGYYGPDDKIAEVICTHFAAKWFLSDCKKEFAERKTVNLKK